MILMVGVQEEGVGMVLYTALREAAQNQFFKREIKKTQMSIFALFASGYVRNTT